MDVTGFESPVTAEEQAVNKSLATHHGMETPRRVMTQIEKGPCPQAFLEGKHICPDSCHNDHDLDFEKIKRGTCLFEFAEKKSCKRGDTCWFSHDIPDELRHSAAMREKMSNSLEKIQTYRQNKNLPKLPIKIETNTTNNNDLEEDEEDYYTVDHFLGQLREMLVKRPILRPNSRDQTRRL